MVPEDTARGVQVPVWLEEYKKMNNGTNFEHASNLVNKYSQLLQKCGSLVGDKYHECFQTIQKELQLSPVLIHHPPTGRGQL